MRLGNGEYNPPASSATRFDATEQFLIALFRLVPSFGDDLTARLEALPVERRRYSLIRDIIEEWMSEHRLPFHLVCDGLDGFSLYGANLPRNANGGMRSWGGPIAQDWYDGIYEKRHDGFRISSTSSDAASADENSVFACPSGPFMFSHPGDDLALSTIKELESEIRFEFDRELARWSTAIRLAAQRRGWTPSASKRPRSRSLPSKDGQPATKRRHSDRAHFRWLVRFQVLGHTLRTIARDAGVTEQSVAQAVRNTATLVGLVRRTEGKPGRPRKARIGSKEARSALASTTHSSKKLRKPTR